MTELMNFLERYWGVSIVGGVTMGTIVTFVFVQLKTFIHDKIKNAQIDQLTELVNTAINKANQMEQERNTAIARNIYFEQVQAVTFKAVSYIVVASKLPTEDKLALQADFNQLAEDAKTLLLAPTKEIQTTVRNDVKEIIQDVGTAVQNVVPVLVQEAVTETTNLLSKYIGER